MRVMINEDFEWGSIHNIMNFTKMKVFRNYVECRHGYFLLSKKQKASLDKQF